MNVAALIPVPDAGRRFAYSDAKFVPAVAGVYALVGVYGDVLYVGQSDNLRRRFGQHLEDEGKTRPTEQGRAAHFYWLEDGHPTRVEKMWLNRHLELEGKLPVLNKNFAPLY